MNGLGFENGVLALAHLTRGLMRTHGVKHAHRGFQVARVLLVQSGVEARRDDEIGDLCHFYSEISLPRNRTQLDLADDGENDRLTLSRGTMTFPHLDNLACVDDASSPRQPTASKR